MSYPNQESPYASPQFQPSAPPVHQQKPSIPVYVMVMAIMDFFWLGLRALVVFFGIVGLFVGVDNPMAEDTGIFEVLAGGAMVLFGFPAAIGMLMRQSWAVTAAWLKVAATLGSVVVGAWQLTYVEEMPSQEAQIGFVAVAGIVMLFRIALIVAYVVAIIMFAKWLSRQQAQPTETIYQ